MQQILIVGSDLESCKSLKYALQDETIQAYYTLSLDEALRQLIHYEKQLVVLDLPSPDINFSYSIEQLQKGRKAPVLLLSPCGDADHIIQALSVANDFLQKPFDVDICKARIKALLRRFDCDESRSAMSSVLSKDSTLLIEGRSRKVYVLSREIILPRKQYDLLYLLASNEGRVFTREQLYQKIWGDDYICGENTLSCHIGELRSKLKAVDGAPDYIKTRYGTGYFFDTAK